MTNQPSLLDAVDELAIPTEGAHHATDPETSVEAARAQLTKVGPQARRCLAALAECGPMTDDELFAMVRAIGPHPITERYIAGTRRGRLRDLGLVEATDVKRKSAKGKNAQVWRLTAEGRRVAEVLRA